MDNTALFIVKTRLPAILEAIEVALPAEPLFVAVFDEGDAIDEATIGDANGVIAGVERSAIAMVVFGSEQVAETTSKMTMVLPFTTQVIFGLPPEATAKQHGAYILGELQKALLAETNRVLPGSNPSSAAIDVRYTGGGSELVPLDDENPCSRWGFEAAWEVVYRQRTTDPTVVT